MLQIRQRNWRLRILMQLTEPKAERMYTSSRLFEIAKQHYPSIKRLTFESLINELIEISALRYFHEKIYINQRSIPPVLDNEAWAYIHPTGIYSLQSVLEKKGVLFSSQSQTTIVMPTRLNEYFSISDDSYDRDGNCTFSTYSIPSQYFPPHIFDEENLVEATTPFPSFVAEKALLDWLLIHDRLRYVEKPPLKINLSLLNIPKFYRLADRMKVRNLVDAYLEGVFQSASIINET